MTNKSETNANWQTNGQSLREYGRGIIGGFIFSLPLLYTMEVWWRGFTAPPAYLLIYVLVTYLLLLGYNRYAGMREDSSWLEVCRDSVEEIGLAFIVTFLFLLLINNIGFQMSAYEIAGKVIIESMVVAIGISVGTAQLGQNNENGAGMKNKGEGIEKHGRRESLLQTLILGICGAVLFASSVAPTEEIIEIAFVSEFIHILFMVLISLLLNYIVLYFSNFKGTDPSKTAFTKIILDILVNYIAALMVSFWFLWFFGRVGSFSFSIILAQMIVLAIPGSIGASAGRLLIKS